MSWFLKRIRACESIPRGYGAAYGHELTVVCAPIPLHAVIAVWVGLWRWFKFGPWRVTETELQREYARGWADANREHARRFMESDTRTVTR